MSELRIPTPPASGRVVDSKGDEWELRRPFVDSRGDEWELRFDTWNLVGNRGIRRSWVDLLQRGGPLTPVEPIEYMVTVDSRKAFEDLIDGDPCVIRYSEVPF